MRKLPIATAQVQDRASLADLSEQALHARLEALAGGGELCGEGLVELAVDIK